MKDKHVIHQHRPHTQAEGIVSQESVLDSFGGLSVSFVIRIALIASRKNCCLHVP